MAGKKETPRQKMIGMMYLVLTALLALQVANSVLDRFDFIDKALRRQNEEKVATNKTAITSIQQAVDEKGNREADVKALERARKVRQMTDDLMAYMESVRQDMLDVTGGLDEAGNPVGKKDYDKVSTMMVHQGKGKELKERLNQYTANLSETAEDEFAPLGVDANQIPGVKDDPDQKLKSFSEYFFENTPTGAGLATVSYLESEVLSYENRALEDIKAMVGAKDVSFDLIFPTILPESNVVAAGAKFKGRLFITARSSAIDPEMKYNLATGEEYPEDKATEVPVEEGEGLVEFTTTPGQYNEENRAEKKFMTYITMNDSTYTYEHTYYVAKPIIQIQSATLQALYFRCGNELDVQVPALGTEYNPSFNVSGGTAIKGSRTGLVTVVPTAAKVALTVFSNGNRIGTENFRVRPVPKPHIELAAQGGRAINFKTGVPASQLRALSIRAVPDEDFANTLPKDAQYRVMEWTVTLARGSRPIGSPMNISGGDQTANLQSLVNAAQPGDRYVVEVKSVARRNFQGRTESVTGLPNTIFTVPLN